MEEQFNVEEEFKVEVYQEAWYSWCFSRVVHSRLCSTISFRLCTSEKGPALTRCCSAFSVSTYTHVSMYMLFIRSSSCSPEIDNMFISAAVDLFD